MQATSEISPPDLVTVNVVEARRAARDYVVAHLDPAFEVVDGERYYSDALGQELWRFFLRCPSGVVGALRVDAQTNRVIRLMDDEIRVLREKSAILTARQQNVLPVDAQGYVLREYARRQAERYLGEQLGMFFNAADPVFVPGEPPRWQVTVVFKRYHLGPFTLGIMDVNAYTGEPLPLTKPQLKRIRERTHALVAFRSSPTAA